MRKIVTVLCCFVMFILGACSVNNTAFAEQTMPLKIWVQNDNGPFHTLCVVDEDTGVNYVVVSTERGNGEYSIAITPRLNANGTLYTGD